MAASPTLIGSVQRALSLLNLVGEVDRPLPAKTLARRAGQPLPTTYHLLRTLVHEGYLRRIEGQGYVLGDQVAVLSGGMAGWVARVRPVLQRLHAELGAAAYLSVLDDGEIRLVDVVDSTAHPRADLWVGFHEAAHATALGKAILSALDDAGRREYLTEHELPDLTPHTVTDRETLLRQLSGSSPYAVDHEEYSLGTVCVAAAVPSPSTVSAVAVSVPARRLPDVLRQSDALRRAARLVAYADAG